MENELKNEENVNVTENEVKANQEPTPVNNVQEQKPEDGKPADNGQAEVNPPTFKEKVVSGAKAFGRGCKTVAKAIKPYAVGAAIGIGAAAYAGLKIYKAVKDGEGGEALGKQDTPLLEAGEFDTEEVVDYSQANDSYETSEVDVSDVVGDVEI